MKLVDLLRKLGIFRHSTEAATYRKAKDRPMSLQADNVFDSEKDVINLGPKAKPPAQDNKH